MTYSYLRMMRYYAPAHVRCSAFFDFAIQPRTTLKCRILDLIFRVITLAYNSSPHTLLKEFFKLKIIILLKRVVGSE